MDRITLHRIVAHGRHGADPGERDRPQPFHIEVAFDLDLSRAGESDALEDTVDYAAVYERIMTIVEQRSYALLERLGCEMLDAIMADGRVVRAEVTIAKPGLLDGATPSVTLVRERQGWP
ncbi:MAG TPA: dihydroneopterin aldolase [Candidatus Lustribacter sp.]